MRNHNLKAKKMTSISSLISHLRKKNKRFLKTRRTSERVIMKMGSKHRKKSKEKIFQKKISVPHRRKMGIEN